MAAIVPVDGARPLQPMGPPAEPARRGNRRGQPSILAAHAVALLLALIVGVALGGPRTAASSDEGAAIHQAVLLQRGGWLLEPTLPELDPELAQQPFLRADVGPKGRAPYAKHPAYPMLLKWASGRWWPHGLVVPGIFGTWVAAVAAAILARALRANAMLPTLWLLGLASPLTVDAQLVLAHAPAAGTAAMTGLASAVALFPDAFGRWWSHRWAAIAAGLAAVLSAAATVLLRSEGTLLVAGLVLGTLVAGVPWRRSIPLASALLAGLVGARAIEVAAIRSILGAAVTAPAPPVSTGGLIASRIEAFQTSWLAVSYNGGVGGAMLAVGVVALVLAVFGARSHLWAPVIVGLLTLGVAGSSAWLLGAPVGLVPGLLPATPWLVGGAASLRPSALGKGLPRFLAATSAVAAGAVLATQYSFGGGVEWGGRFYAIVLPLAAPLLIAAVWPAAPGWWRGMSGPVVFVVVAVSALVSVGGILAVGSSHRRTSGLAAQVATASRAALPGRAGDPDRRAVVVGPQRLWPQLLWPDVQDHRWVTVDANRLPCAFHGLRAAGFQHLVLLGPSVGKVLALAEPQGWRLVDGSTAGMTSVVEAAATTPGSPPICPPGRGW